MQIIQTFILIKQIKKHLIHMRRLQYIFLSLCPNRQNRRLCVNVKMNMYIFDYLRMYKFTRFHFPFLSDFLNDTSSLRC